MVLTVRITFRPVRDHVAVATRVPGLGSSTQHLHISSQQQRQGKVETRMRR